jgi:hypothetical protein
MDSSGRSSSSRTLHLDRSYNSPVIERQLRAPGLDDVDIQRRGTKIPGVKKQPRRLGMRWNVETTNRWWSNDGQLRRNTDRRARHRHAALCLATTILIIGKLLTHRDRWSPKSAPIR